MRSWTRWMRGLSVVALTILAACTAAPPDDVAAPSPSGTADVTAEDRRTSADEDRPTPSEEERVRTDGEWSLDALDPGGAHLRITVPSGGCTEFEAVEVREDDRTVEITAVVTEPAPAAIIVCTGGGGWFVATSSNSPLLVAGGGGGAGSNTTGGNGVGGTTAQLGTGDGYAPNAPRVVGAVARPRRRPAVAG
jgi:hypothetical protein